MDKGQKALTVLMHLLRMAVGWHFLYEGVWKLMQGGTWSCLSYLDGAQGPLAGLFKWMASQPWLVTTGDYAVMWGLTLIGVSLVTGVLARLAAVFAILLMAMFYAAQPPEPFATAMSGADGRFFLFERNAIEALALLAIAVIPCWRGWVRSLVPGAAVLALFGGLAFGHYRDGGFKKSEAVTSATVKVHEFTALAALRAKLSEHVEIGGVKVSRLALGGDLYAGHAHARDLIWPDEFMRRYNLGGALERTIRYAVRCGITAIFAERPFMDTVKAAAAEAGGSLAYFVNCADAADAQAAKEKGAAGVYARPELVDVLVRKDDRAALAALFAALRATGLPVGIGSEDVASVKYCVKSGLVPDYWVLAFHSHKYQAADLGPGFNNMWCADPEGTAAYMKTRKEPWVSIRGLAGGGILPIDACRFAYANGVGAVALDLLDFRIADSVNDAMIALGKLKPEPKKEAKK